MKRTLKILTILLLAVMLVSITTNVFAAEIKPGDLNASFGTDTSGLTTKVGQIMGMIRNIAVIASVIILMILGVKFMLGSVEEKAEYKKAFMPLIIGIILVVAATSIAAFIFDMVA